MSEARVVSRFAFLILCALSVAGCASTGGGGNAAPATVSMSVGDGTAGDVMERGNRILTRFQFRTAQAVGAPAIHIESRWKNRSPFADEVAVGVEQAQSRIIIRGRERSVAAGSITLFAVTFIVETQVQTTTSNGWIELPASQELKDWARDMGNELSLELEKIRSE